MEQVMHMNLNEIVEINPSIALLMERHKVDFCCSGKKTLAEAMADRPEELKALSLEINRLLNSSSQPAVDFAAMGVGELVQYILEEHHDYVKESLVAIQRHLSIVTGKYASAHPELYRIKELFDSIKEDFLDHLLKEEQFLFPQIIQLDSRSKRDRNQHAHVRLQHPFHVMEHEHERAGELMAEIRKLSNNYQAPANACTRHKLLLEELKCFEADLLQHAYVEDEILFPRVIELQKAVLAAKLN